MVRSKGPATNGHQSCRTADREVRDEDEATVTPRLKSKGIKVKYPIKTKLRKRSREEETAPIQIWTLEHFQDLQQLATPFNPNSGQRGIEAAPRSCKPQAYLLVFYGDRITLHWNDRSSTSKPNPKHKTQIKENQTKTQKNKICAVVHKRKPRTESTTNHGGHGGKNLVDNRLHLWG
ncbi:hypothetical protein VPH35_048804 [Triticum aestivum]